MDCHSLLQGICLTLRLNLYLLHYRQILYLLSHQESPFDGVISPQNLYRPSSQGFKAKVPTSAYKGLSRVLFPHPVRTFQISLSWSSCSLPLQTCWHLYCFSNTPGMLCLRAFAVPIPLPGTFFSQVSAGLASSPPLGLWVLVPRPRVELMPQQWNHRVLISELPADPTF